MDIPIEEDVYMYLVLLFVENCACTDTESLSITGIPVVLVYEACRST